MRRLIVTATAVAAVFFTASALAVLPSQRSVFRGVTSEHAVNGYKPTIQFTALAGGRTLKFFTFQTLGCFGHGSFPVGTDPFVETPWRLPAIKVNPNGAYSAKVKATSPAPSAGKMVVTITGSFTSASKASGKLTFSQDQEGATCGPKTVKFAATANAS
jgi:hypothetical protein